MTLEGAIIQEQGIRFAIVVVKPQVVQNRFEANRTISSLTPTFGAPVVLMAQDSRGIPTYFGRPDIVRFLSNVHPSQIPWKKFTVR